MNQFAILPFWSFTLVIGSSFATMDAQCRFPMEGKGGVLTYTFDPAITPTSTVLHVTLNFQGGHEGMEEVEVPSHWAGETLRGILNLRALSANTVIADSASPDTKRVRHPPNQPVFLTYDIVKDWTGPFRSPMQFHGVLMPEYLEINGSNGLVHPKLTRQTPITVNFD